MVSDKISPGLKGQRETVVCEHNAASHVGKFSTPSMIHLMEMASAESIQPLLEPGQLSVGYEVNIRHLAPAPIGARIIAHCMIIQVDRNRLTFKVEAYNGDTKIGEGTHQRAIIRAESSGT